MKKRNKLIALSVVHLAVQHAYAGVAISDVPVALGGNVPPLNMLVMNRDHTLFYDAYNDASDLTGDNIPEITYLPSKIDYYGYFDSNLCYNYDASNEYFYPVSKGAKISGGTGAYKVCSGVSGARWSGDFLNYATMSKIDIIRKVLFGGRRIVDTATSTVLERAAIPQDAHSWGKEYSSLAAQDYTLSDFTPYSTLENVQDGSGNGLKTLFTSTTLGSSSSNNKPLLRVLTKTKYGQSDWVTKESPIAGNNIGSGTNNLTSSFSWGTQPAALSTGVTEMVDYFSGGTTTVNNINAGASSSTSVLNHNTSDTTITTYLIPNPSSKSATVSLGVTVKSGSGNIAIFNSNGVGSTNNIVASIVGAKSSNTLTSPNMTIGGYGYAYIMVDGDLDFTVNVTNNRTAANTLYTGITYIKRTKKSRNVTITPELTDYVVRVKACEKISGVEPDASCKLYGSGTSTIYKPTGILQTYGDNGKMKFGLMTGGFKNNLDFGTLRKNVAEITDEIDVTNGTFKSTNGMIKMLSNLKMDGFSSEWTNCTLSNSGAVLTQGKLINNRCGQWGAPTGELIHEAILYFQGDITKRRVKDSAGTVDVSYGSSASDADVTSRNWVNAAWVNPYGKDASGNAYNLSCSKPFMTVISDSAPTFDSDVPSSPWTSEGDTSKGVSGIVGLTRAVYSDIGAQLWTNEFKGAKKVIIGEVKNPVAGEVSDGTPVAKTTSNFANIRGIAPLRPTQEGSFSSAILSNFAREKGVTNSLGKNVKINTLNITFPSHLPTFEVPVNGKKVIITPFGKSVGEYSINRTEGSFQPTNTIVDFYMLSLFNVPGAKQDTSVNGGLPYYKFRIAYEDVEAGQDHELDSLVEYELKVIKDAGIEKLTITATSIRAAAGIVMHHGYAVQGSATQDGLYLVVRQYDKTAATDANYKYYLDKNDNRESGGLPLTDTRTFTTGTSDITRLENPMYYAAKYGGYLGGDTLTTKEQWDQDGDGSPDNYFYATNPGELASQLNNAFTNLTKRLSAASAVATSSTSLNNGLRLYQATFNSGDWSGDLYSLPVENSDVKDADWSVATKLATQTSRTILTRNSTSGSGVEFNFSNLSATQKAALDVVTPESTVTDGLAADRVSYLKGDQTLEGTTFRKRKFLIGDIVNSAPAYVSAPNDIWIETAVNGKTPYGMFKSKYKDRKPMVYVGANDGMLHAFDASIDTSTNKPTTNSGKEVFGFIPSDSTMVKNLTWLTNKTYLENHKYFVDSTPVVRDVELPSAKCSSDEIVTMSVNGVSTDTCYRSMLVSGLGAGGKSYFALDVTDPTNFTSSNANKIVKWEFSADNIDAADKADMNYSFGRPFITKANDGNTWALVSNGLAKDSSSSNGYIFAIRMSGPTGPSNTWVKNVDYVKIPLGLSTDGAGEISCADIGKSTVNGTAYGLAPELDQKSDVCYVGDPAGNLWRVNMTSALPTSWGVDLTSGTGTSKVNMPLFTTYTTSGDKGKKPILSAPELTYFPYGKAINGEAYKNILVYVGTGKYLGTTDKQSTDLQGVYTVWDDNMPSASYASLTKNNLEVRTITTVVDNKGTSSTTDDETFRTITGDAICWNGLCKDTGGNLITGDYGWYNEYPSQGTNPAERFVGTLQLYGRNLYFNSLIPSTDPCEFGGTGWLMAVDYLSGLTPTTSLFDTNSDSKINSSDKRVSGKKIGASIGGSTLVKPINGSSDAIAITSLLSGELQVTKVTGKSKQERILSWKEIFD